mgnify:FL=1
MENIELKIEGMHCTGCSARLQKVLSNLDGVSNAEVSFEKGMANIEFNKEIVTLDEIKNAIVDSGFEVE